MFICVTVAPLMSSSIEQISWEQSNISAGQQISLKIHCCFNLLVQGGAKRTHVFEMGSSRESEAVSLFGVTSNQKPTFENLVQSTI